MKSHMHRGEPAIFLPRLLASLLFFLTVSLSEAMSYPPPPPGEVNIEGHLNSACLPHSGGTVYLLISVTTGSDRHPDPVRRPLNLAVVLDRSGSMAEERKFDYAREAVCSLLDHLNGQDFLSIIVYDDRIETLLPTQRVRDRNAIKAILEEVYPRGSTNLGGGMQEGFRQIERNFRPECVNRVILLSDGLANRGITDPRRLNELAACYRAKSISLSTIGVGLEYNENLMLGLSQHGGGNYYFVESGRQLSSIFDHEFDGMSAVVAQNALVDLTPGRGVEIRDVIGAPWHREAGRVLFDVGDLYADDRREYTVELGIPEGSGVLHAARGVVRWDCRTGLPREMASFEVDVRYTDIDAELRRGKDWDVQGKTDLSISTRRVEHAMKALDEGRREDAKRELSEARSDVLNSAALVQSAVAAPALREQALRLKGYADSVSNASNDSRLVKTSVQYQNYRTQRQKP